MANLINPLIKNEEEVQVNFSYFTGEEAASIPVEDALPIGGEPKKRGRPPKPKKMSDGGYVIPADAAPLTMLQTDESYGTTYGETNALLRGTIGEIDSLNKDVREQLDVVKTSKTIRKKYEYVSDLASTSANLLGTKIRAIQEIDSNITQGHNLDMKRAKDLKLSLDADKQDENQRIMDMYNAYINTPMGVYNPGQPIPTPQEMMLPNTPGIAAIDISGQVPMGMDLGFAAYQAAKTPEENMMTLQKVNPNIKTVVVYDQNTQNRYFDVIDVSTGQSIPNVPRPDPFLLDDTTINVQNGVARNSNIDTVYPLVLTGAPDSILNY